MGYYTDDYGVIARECGKPHPETNGAAKPPGDAAFISYIDILRRNIRAYFSEFWRFPDREFISRDWCADEDLFGKGVWQIFEEMPADRRRAWAEQDSSWDDAVRWE